MDRRCEFVVTEEFEFECEDEPKFKEIFIFWIFKKRMLAEKWQIYKWMVCQQLNVFFREVDEINLGCGFSESWLFLR